MGLGLEYVADMSGDSMNIARRLVGLVNTWRGSGLRLSAKTDKVADQAATAAVMDAMRAGQRTTVLLKAGQGSSGIGGQPHLTTEIDWPTCDARPLSFIAELDLAMIRAAGGPEWLPDNGFLFFFYDHRDMPWGYDPAHRGGWTVIHAHRAPIARPFPAGLDKDDQFDRVELEASRGTSYPTPDRLEESSSAADCDIDAAYDFLEQIRGASPDHRVGGYPSPAQGDDMELEAQLASNGVYLGNGNGYKSKAAMQLKAGAADWRLLLQVDSDDDAGMMWGDVGLLYFWIREDDALARDFSKVWLILQCS